MFENVCLNWYYMYLPFTVNCTVPVVPFNDTITITNVNGIVFDYEMLNETVLEGTVLTYQCNNGLSLTEPNTITCTNAGVWSIEPEEITCVLTEGNVYI